MYRKRRNNLRSSLSPENKDKLRNTFSNVSKTHRSNYVVINDSKDKKKVDDHYNLERVNSFGKLQGKPIRPQTIPLTMIQEQIAHETENSNRSSSTLTPMYNSTLTGNNSSTLIVSKETSRDTGKNLKESLIN